MRIVLLMAMMHSCSQALTNEQIIEEVNKCRNAKLGYKFIRNGLTDDIIKTQCYYGKGE